jgi:ATP-dependent Zn protease
MKYEPQTGSGVKFSDVHGVDEAKEVCNRDFDLPRS